MAAVGIHIEFYHRLVAQTLSIEWARLHYDELLGDPVLLVLLLQTLLPTHGAELVHVIRAKSHTMYETVRPTLFACANKPRPDGSRDQSFVRLLLETEMHPIVRATDSASLLALLRYPDDMHEHYRLDAIYRDIHYISARHPTFIDLHNLGFRCTRVPPRLYVPTIAAYKTLCQSYAPPPEVDMAVVCPVLLGLFEQNHPWLAKTDLWDLEANSHVPLCPAVALRLDASMADFAARYDLRRFRIPVRPERTIAALLKAWGHTRGTLVIELIGPQGVWWSLPGANRVRTVTIERIMRRLKRNLGSARSHLVSILLLLRERFAPGGYTSKMWRQLAAQFFNTLLLSTTRSRLHSLPGDVCDMIRSYIVF